MPPLSRKQRSSRAARAADLAPALRGIPLDLAATGDVVQLLSLGQQVKLAGLATRVRLPQRTIVYREDAAAGWVYIVAQGVMKAFRDLPSGKRRIVAFLFADDLFGLSEGGRYVNTAQAVTPVTLYRMPMEELTVTLRRDPELEFQFLAKITHELRASQRQTIVVARRDAVGRFAMFLHMLEQQTKLSGRTQIDISMSRSDMANYLGLTLEAVSRASRDLESSRIVDFVGAHSARVVNRTRFDALVAAL